MDDRVTVHHLLSHTSGIGDYFEEDEDLPGYIGEDYGQLWRDRPSYRMERPDDFLDPRTLSPLTRATLKEAFRAVASVQRRINAEMRLGAR